MVDTWILARTAKFVGLLWFAHGLVGATLFARRADRVHALYRNAVPGFVVVAGAGWILMKQRGLALTTPWLLVGTLLGFCSLATGFAASHGIRVSRVARAVSWGSLSVAAHVMTLRPGALLDFVIAGLVGGSIGAFASWPNRPETFGSTEDAFVTVRAFRTVAWLEGASWVVLLGAMGLRAMTGTRLDGGTGLVGWLHGVLVLIFLAALAFTRPIWNGARRDLVLGVICALLPFGTFWFERRLTHRAAVLGDESSPSQSIAS